MNNTQLLEMKKEIAIYVYAAILNDREILDSSAVFVINRLGENNSQKNTYRVLAATAITAAEEFIEMWKQHHDSTSKSSQ